MLADAFRGEFQFTTVTTAVIEESISKINELGNGTGVGANYYPHGSQMLKVRFGDHKHGQSHVVLAPQEIAAIRAYIQQKDPVQGNPHYNRVLAVFKDADDALRRAQDYIREKSIKQGFIPTPRIQKL